MPQGWSLGLQRGFKILANSKKRARLSKLSWWQFKFNWVNEYRVFCRTGVRRKRKKAFLILSKEASLPKAKP
jgi:hypothetical protein